MAPPSLTLPRQILGESTMHHRHGTTLMEVLVAIFVMGVGMLAVMAMFPLAAVSMARSIRDDRIAHAATNAKAIAIAKSIRIDSQLFTAVRDYFANPNFDGLAANDGKGQPILFITPTPTNPSWTLFVDPVGDNTYSNPGREWVGGNVGRFGGIRRRSRAGVL